MQRQSYGLSPLPPDVSPNGRYSTTQAAAKLGIHRNTLTNAFKAGKIRAIDPTAQKLHYYGRELSRYWHNQTC